MLGGTIDDCALAPEEPACAGGEGERLEDAGAFEDVEVVGVGGEPGFGRFVVF